MYVKSNALDINTEAPPDRRGLLNKKFRITMFIREVNEISDMPISASKPLQAP